MQTQPSLTFPWQTGPAGLIRKALTPRQSHSAPHLLPRRLYNTGSPLREALSSPIQGLLSLEQAHQAPYQLFYFCHLTAS